MVVRVQYSKLPQPHKIERFLNKMFIVQKKTTLRSNCIQNTRNIGLTICSKKSSGVVE